MPRVRESERARGTSRSSPPSQRDEQQSDLLPFLLRSFDFPLAAKLSFRRPVIGIYWISPLEGVACRALRRSVTQLEYEPDLLFSISQGGGSHLIVIGNGAAYGV